jgi:hypothetical protein
MHRPVLHLNSSDVHSADLVQLNSSSPEKSSSCDDWKTRQKLNVPFGQSFCVSHNHVLGMHKVLFGHLNRLSPHVRLARKANLHRNRILSFIVLPLLPPRHLSWSSSKLKLIHTRLIPPNHLLCIPETKLRKLTQHKLLLTQHISRASALQHRATSVPFIYSIDQTALAPCKLRLKPKSNQLTLPL